MYEETVCFEKKHLESIEAQLYEIKQKKEQENLSKEKMQNEGYQWEKCPICHKSDFQSLNSFLDHWNENHLSSFGEYRSFMTKYPRYVKKLLSATNKETEDRMKKAFQYEMLKLALTTPVHEDRLATYARKHASNWKTTEETTELSERDNDSKILESVTLKEELSEEPKKELPNLVKIFGKEILETLSKSKKKGLHRKTKTPNSVEVE